ncbi:MAG: hypothetical protein JZU65_06220 [Chlorobium sp.]|nr:hypothetical protein [Chlorobium sp.]
MCELNSLLEKQRNRQAELLKIIEAGYDENAIRDLNVLNNNIQVTERRIKKTFIDNKVISPMHIAVKQHSY